MKPKTDANWMDAGAKTADAAAAHVVLKAPDGFTPSTAPHPIHDDPNVPRPRIARTLGGRGFDE